MIVDSSQIKRNLIHGEIFSSMGVIFKEKLSFKTAAKFQGGKHANELIHNVII